MLRKMTAVDAGRPRRLRILAPFAPAPAPAPISLNALEQGSAWPRPKQPAARSPRGKSRSPTAIHRFGNPARRQLAGTTGRTSIPNGPEQLPARRAPPAARPRALVRHARPRRNTRYGRAQHVVQFFLDLLQRHHLAADPSRSATAGPSACTCPSASHAGPCRPSRTSRRGSPAPRPAPACPDRPCNHVWRRSISRAGPRRPMGQYLGASSGSDHAGPAQAGASGGPTVPVLFVDLQPGRPKRLVGACSPRTAGDSFRAGTRSPPAAQHAEAAIKLLRQRRRPAASPRPHIRMRRLAKSPGSHFLQTEAQGTWPSRTYSVQRFFAAQLAESRAACRGFGVVRRPRRRSATARPTGRDG